MITLATGFYVGYIKNNVLEKIQKDLKSHDINGQGTIVLARTVFVHGWPIPIQHISDGANVSPQLS